ncbi:MAG: O-antigen ligase family protein [Porphyrobacter sp.]|nr:O-antigen ligase family protein [Porphyrobacter sp.]
MRHVRHSDKIRFPILVGLIAACFLMGGASRLDVTSLILLQPLAAVCATAFLLLPGPIDWQPVRFPLIFLAALAGLMVAQLIPLPPAVWSNFPGQAPFVQSAALAGIEQSWRPMSLTPDLTLASLVGLVVPFAILIGFASIDARRRPLLLVALLAGSVVSAVFALGQVSGGPKSPFYLYDVTNLEAGVGLFANRNHQAVLLAMTLPMLTVWATSPRQNSQRRTLVRWVAIGFALFLLPLLLVTGSRAGLLLGLLALGSAWLLWRKSAVVGTRRAEGIERFVPALIGGVAVLALVATVFLSRAEAVQRLFALKVGQDTRVEATPILLEMARDFLPLGSGFGSFDPLFRFYEPLEKLDLVYLNHAHNDLLEIVITSGVPGLFVVALFLGWFSWNALAAWRADAGSQTAQYARLASVMILLPLISSLVDYPLRTPLMMAIVAVASGWLGALSASRRQLEVN